MIDLIYNVMAVTPQGVSQSYVAIDSDGIIAEVVQGNPSAERLASARHSFDGQGAMLLPGAIDAHVHFREPGLTHKATIASESAAAVAGGVTSYLDMPNTLPQTVGMAEIDAKREIAAQTSLANYGFFIGATNNNLDTLLKADYTRVAGIKLFMGSSTGGMLVNDPAYLDRLFKDAPAIISIHAESESEIAKAKEKIISQYGENPPVALHSQLRSAEACFQASQQAVRLAKKHNTRIHIAHLTSASELALFRNDIPLTEKRITAEVSPHHLLWSDQDYELKGARIKMNPSVKTPLDRQRLLEAVDSGLIDIIATDHAPHLLSEKEGGLFKAVSGAPMVQFSLPAMLDMFAPEKVARLMAENPATLFNIRRRGRIQPGYYADLALVKEIPQGYTVTDADVVSLCGWTPLNGFKLHHKVVATWVNGNLIYENGVIKENIKANPLEFDR